jgi:hypothetical protein
MKEAKADRKNRILGWIAVIMFAGFLFMHWKLPHVQVPRQLIGTWTTKDPRYSGRSFEIGAETISFGMGKAEISVGFIQNVESTSETSGTFYTISYTLDGSRDQVSFRYGDGDKTLRFLHQEQIVWVKDDNS